MINYDEYYAGVSNLYNTIRLDAEEDFNNTISVIMRSVGEGGNILDIGCGTGKYGERLNTLGYFVKGIDKSESQVEEAKNVIDAQIGTSDHLPFDSESFDACLMIMMLHQLDPTTREASFEEIHRVLVPNGNLIIKTASHEDLKRRFSSIYFPSAYKEDLKRYPSIETIKDELKGRFSVNEVSSMVEVKFDKLDLAHKFMKRRTSNLRNISDDELNKGIEDFLRDYQKYDSFVKNSYYTFVIARKL